jgi:hypothetical protein
MSAPRFSCASTMRRLAALAIKRQAEEDWGREKNGDSASPWASYSFGKIGHGH